MEEQQPVIVFVGDSLTAGGDWNALLSRSDCVNHGIAGDTSAMILNRINHSLNPGARAYVLLAGINDLSRGRPSNEISANLTAIIQRMKQASPDAVIILQSVMPVNENIRAFVFDLEAIPRLNRQLDDLARELKVDFLDMYPVMQDDQGRLKTSYTLDGLHLSAEGYRVWADLLEERLPVEPLP